MACNCDCKVCENLVTATAVATANGVTTITLPATFAPVARNNYCVLIRVPIDATTECNSVSITNGTTTWSVLSCDGNNWRPCRLRCRSIIKVRFLDDPAHFLFKSVRR